MYEHMENDFNLTKFRRRLRQMIKVQYGTASSFARACGLPQNTLYSILNMNILPTVQTLALMCDRLGCTMEFLLGLNLEASDSNEAYESAIRDVQTFKDKWSRSRKLFLAYTTLGFLTEAEEERLKCLLNPEAEGKARPAGHASAPPMRKNP